MTAADVLLISVDLGETPAIMHLDRFLNRKRREAFAGIRFCLRMGARLAGRSCINDNDRPRGGYVDSGGGNGVCGDLQGSV